MKNEEINKLVTEGINESTVNIDEASTLEIIEMINNEDRKVAEAVGKAKKSIAKAVDIVYERLARGGRLFYVGAGTSGRIGILDASECPPTYGVDYQTVQGVMAGGVEAIFKAKEGIEDREYEGVKDLKEKNITEKDIICGIAASGRTPYVIGAMKYGKKVGAAVICVTMNPGSKMEQLTDVPITIVVGPEAVMGSTRMKAGTAQKMVLNMITTGAMIKLGKVYGNLMVDVKPTNEKLVIRAKRIVKLATDGEDDLIEKILKETSNSVKLSIVMIKTGLGVDEAKKLLDENKGYVKKAIKAFSE